MAEKRRPFPLYNKFRDFVTQELERRGTTFPTPVMYPFTRLTSCQTDVAKDYKFFTLGLHGFDNTELDIFGATYVNRNIVGHAISLSDGSKTLISAEDLSEAALPQQVISNSNGATLKRIGQDRETFKESSHIGISSHPIPGITSVRVNRKGVGTPLTAEVEFVCYNRGQLEFLRHHFLTAGRYVVLEWGNEFSDKGLSNILDFSAPDALGHLRDCIVKGRRGVTETWSRQNNGNYDFMVGMLGNYRLSMDAKTGVYTCSLTIYTFGEYSWGLNMTNTNNSKGNEKGSFNDFFSYGGQFDALVESHANDKSLVTEAKADHSKDHLPVPDRFGSLSSDGRDYRFISWQFFTQTILRSLLKLLDDPNAKSDLIGFVNLYDGTQSLTTANDKTPTNPNEPDYVGFNKYLMSTDPSTMILVHSGLKAVPPMFVGAGNMDDTPYRGTLTRGVWLNTGMIRSAFHGSNTFIQAINTIVERMNNATMGYWGLKLFYDDELNVYKIIDLKYGDRDPEMAKLIYKFNQPTNGNLLEVELDSAFPPELVSQIAFYAQIKGAPPDKAAEYFKQYPMLGSTSSFIFAVNWTGLHDMLEEELQKVHWTGPSDPELRLVAAPSGSTRTVSRVTAVDGVLTAPKMATSPNGAPEGKKASEINVVTTTPPSIGFPYDKSKNLGARHNNPGNLEYRQEWVSYGATPSSDSGGRWAVFPTPEAGFKALCRQIEIDKGRGLSVSKFVYKFAPPFENNTAAYLAGLCARLNVGPNSPLTVVDTTSMAVEISKKETSATFAGFVTKPNTDPTQMFSGGVVTPTALGRITQRPEAVAAKPIRHATAEELAEGKRITDEYSFVLERFGKEFANIFAIVPSYMVSMATQDGYLNYPSPNSFVAPYPTKTTITITLPGLAGFSVSDVFYVDRLPFIFERYGCFQVVEIAENITKDGWKTTIKGIFTLLFLEGEGQKK